MKSRMLISLLVIALAAAVIGGATMAWFTDKDDAGAATFTAGTLKIDVSDGLATFEGLLPESKHGNMNPGDVYDEIEIIIENNGSKKLGWVGNWTVTQVDSQLSDALLDGIYIKTMKMEFLSPGENLDWETADQFITDGVGSGDYSNWYNTLANMSSFDRKVVTLRNWIDNNGMGVTPNEHMGALMPGYKYKLTVQFAFHEECGNDYQGDVASPVEVGFEVKATQIVAEALEKELGLPNASSHEDWMLKQIAKQEAVLQN